MATTNKREIKEWNNFHCNGPFPTKVLYETSLERKSNMPSIIDRYNDAAAEIQRLIKEVADSNEGFRAIGSAWSMSHIAHHHDNMHVNARMNLKKIIAKDEFREDSLYQRDNLFFLQCGNTVKEISNFLFDHGKSLPVSGASNGQTIGGCLSTGVHGSAFDVGAVQDIVVGINLITGPDQDDIVYIERQSKPALCDAFANTINARVLRDDDLFNAAVVGLGAFGFIHGVVINVEDRFLLNRYVRKIDKDTALDLAKTLDFDNTSFQIPEEIDARGKKNRPYHYKVFINPYTNDQEYMVEVIYKKPYRENYPDPLPRIKTAVYRDLIVLFTKIVERCNNSIPKMIQLLKNFILPPADLEVTGTLPEIFWDAGYQGPAFAIAVGVDHKDSAKALDVLVKLAKEEGPVPGIYSMRFVKQSKATLAFTKFPITCMLEIDGLIWDSKRDKVISLEKFSTRLIEVLQAANIPFTMHWGKNGDWEFPGLVEYMYGANAKTWKLQRSALLNEQMANVFSNQFLDDIGLSEYLVDAPMSLIASID